MKPALPEALEWLPDRRDPPSPGLAVELAALDGLQARLGRRFRRPALLRAALTLGSWCNEHPDAAWPSNACLEFFGDAVLDLLAADALWRRFPGLGEGDLTRLRATLVSTRALAAVAREIDLGAALFAGRGDLRGGVHTRARTLADALEAVTAAVFLDAREAGEDPLAAAAVVFDALFGARVRALTGKEGFDAKSSLQQRLQAEVGAAPTYELVGAPPSSSDPLWRARAVVEAPASGRRVLGEGEGSSRKRAEQAAAAAALAELDCP